MATAHITPFPTSSTNPHCRDCGAPIWVTSAVPESAQKQITLDNKLLCINCLAKRCLDAGLSDVPVQLDAGPLRAVAYAARQWFLDDYRGYLHSQDKAEKTIYNYLIDVRLFAEWISASGYFTGIVSVSREDVKEYREHLQTIKRRPATINRNLVAIRLYFDWLMQTERVMRNPARGVKRVAQVAPKPRKLSAEEVGRIEAMATARGDGREIALISLLRHTGLRAAEACALCWDALALDRYPHLVEVRRGKGNKTRFVPLNEEVRAALISYRGTLDPAPAEADFVFGAGKPLPPKTLNRIIHRLADLAQVDDVSAHDFRHFFAYQVIRTTPIHILQELMGHAHINTTSVYTNPTMDDLIKATQGLLA